MLKNLSVIQMKNKLSKTRKYVLDWIKLNLTMLVGIRNFVLYVLVYGLVFDFVLNELFGLDFNIRKIVALGLVIWMAKYELSRWIREVMSR